MRIDGLALAVLLGSAAARAAAAPGAHELTDAVTVAVAESPAATASSSTSPAAELAPGSGAGDRGRRTLHRLPANLGRGLVGVLSGDSLVPFLVGGTAAASASFFDHDVRNSFQGNTLNWGDSLETGAGPIWSTVFVASMFTAGQLSHHPRFEGMTYDMVGAAVVNFAYTEVIKTAAGRERPNGQDHQSFPSGHTSNSFALATVAQQHYGWKIGVPAYLLAGLVGVSRLEQDKHYLSDVVAGATLGYVVGRTVARVNGRPLAAAGHRASVRACPVLSRRTRGAQVAVVF